MKKFKIRLDINPVPKARPRFSFKNKKFYTPNKTKQAEIEIKKLLLEKIKKPPFFKTEELLMLLVFYVKNDRKRDLDNYIKLLLDAGNKIIYTDDSQIKGIFSYFAKGSPRIELCIFELKSEFVDNIFTKLSQ